MDDYKVSFSPQQLQAMTDTHISSLFHSSNWSQLSNASRLDLCQELENRLAAADQVAPRSVVPEKMNGACYGYQQGNKIAVNVDMLNHGVFTTTFTDEHGNNFTTTHQAPAASWSTYDTIAHEHTHGVNLDRGVSPYTYFSSNTDYNLYRIQNEEKVAFDTGNKATLAAIKQAETALGKQDPEKAAYLQSIAADNYEQCLNNARQAYNDPFIDQTLSQFISDRDKGIYPENRSPSYEQLENLYDQQVYMEINGLLDKDLPMEPVQNLNDPAQILQSNDSMNLVTPEPTPVMINEGVNLIDSTDAVDYGSEGVDMSVSADTVDYGSDGADVSVSADTADYGSDGADVSVSADTVDYGNDGADVSVSADTADYGSDGADVSVSADTVDYGSDGGMDLD